MTTRKDDEPVVLGYDPAEMREWLTAGAGADLTGRTDSGDAPVGLLPPAGAPTSVMRNTRVPWEVDVAVKAQADGRGISVSEWIREAILGKLAGDYDATPDPVVELRLTLAAATRALDRLDGREAA
jgi:hypothetical protein